MPLLSCVVAGWAILLSYICINVLHGLWWYDSCTPIRWIFVILTGFSLLYRTHAWERNSRKFHLKHFLLDTGFFHLITCTLRRTTKGPFVASNPLYFRLLRARFKNENPESGWWKIINPVDFGVPNGPKIKRPNRVHFWTRICRCDHPIMDGIGNKNTKSTDLKSRPFLYFFQWIFYPFLLDLYRTPFTVQ